MENCKKTVGAEEERDTTIDENKNKTKEEVKETVLSDDDLNKVSGGWRSGHF